MKNLLIISLLLLTTAMVAQRNKFKNIIEKDGNIGIGTKAPDALLTVKGQIHTQEVLVDMEGAVAPDYVFSTYFEGASEIKPDYKLLTLTEVENYIEENHHLPNIPSAATLERDGLFLKEMNLLLLQKVEELTLYTLEQQKEIDALKEMVNSIKD